MKSILLSKRSICKMNVIFASTKYSHQKKQLLKKQETLEWSKYCRVSDWSYYNPSRNKNHYYFVFTEITNFESLRSSRDRAPSLPSIQWVFILKFKA